MVRADWIIIRFLDLTHRAFSGVVRVTERLASASYEGHLTKEVARQI